MAYYSRRNIGPSTTTPDQVKALVADHFWVFCCLKPCLYLNEYNPGLLRSSMYSRIHPACSLPRIRSKVVSVISMEHLKKPGLNLSC